MKRLLIPFSLVIAILFLTGAASTTISYFKGISASGTASVNALVATNTIIEAGNQVPNATDNLGFFAATTSLQLSGNISDEVGTGSALFGNQAVSTGSSPTFIGMTLSGATALTLAMFDASKSVISGPVPNINQIFAYDGTSQAWTGSPVLTNLTVKSAANFGNAAIAAFDSIGNLTIPTGSKVISPTYRIDNNNQWTVGNLVASSSGSASVTTKFIIGQPWTTSPTAAYLSANYGAIWNSNTVFYLTTTSDGSTLKTVRLPGVQTVKVDTTTTGNVGAGEDTLITFTVPAAQLPVTGDRLDFDTWGSFAANANTKDVKVYFGATVLIDSTALILNGISWRAHGKIVRTGAATQIATAELNIGGTLLSALTTSIVLTTSPAETLSGTVVFKVTGEDSGGVPVNNSIVQNGMTLTFYPVP